jgi:hypothetical protein
MTTRAATIVPGFGMGVCIKVITDSPRIHVTDCGWFARYAWLGWAMGRGLVKGDGLLAWSRMCLI